MTLQQAAEAHFDQQTNRAWRSWPEHQRLDAVQDFIAGAEWAFERAAQVAGDMSVANEFVPGRIAAAIRSLSTTSIPISGSSGSDSENTIEEEK